MAVTIWRLIGNASRVEVATFSVNRAPGATACELESPLS